MHTISKLLLTQLKKAPPHVKFIVAYSGGVDSTVLLHALVMAKQSGHLPNAILAVHVNHQLSEYANHWQSHCERQAQALGAPLVNEVVNVEPVGQGVEQAARQARYQALSHHVSKGDWLLCGHHQGDQLETFLLRLMRGSGVAGLAAMAATRPFEQGTLVRPLLSVTKEQLLAYAREHQLQWVEDDSNQSDDYDRNYLRNHVVPPLLTRWPKAQEQAAHAARLLGQTQQLLVEYAATDLQVLNPQVERLGTSIQLPKRDWGQARVAGVLRHWLDQLALKAPTAKQLAQLQNFVLANEDAQPLWVHGGREFRRFKGRIYQLPELPTVDTTQPLPIEQVNTVLSDGAILSIEPLPKQTLHVRFQTLGLRVHPMARAHSQTYKKVMQEYAVEPWLRTRVPLIYSEDTLLAVGDLWLEQIEGKGDNPLHLSEIRWCFSK